MPQELTETTQKVVYAGPFSPEVLTAIGLAAAVIVVLLAWREARTVRWWLIPVVAALRLAAVAVVLWMLAGVSLVTVTRHSRPKSVAILIDTSGSMGLTDSADSAGNAARWALLNGEDRPAELLRAVDGGAAALGLAVGEFNRFADQCRQAGASRAVEQHIAAARSAADDAARLLSRFCDRAPAASAGDAAALRDQLEDAVAPQLQALGRDLLEGRLQVDEGADKRLAEMRETMGGLARRAARVADATAIQVQETADAALQGRLRDVGALRRFERAATLLADAERGWLGELRKKAHVVSYRFAEAPAFVASEDWRREQAAWLEQAQRESSTDLAGALEKVAQDAAGQPVQALLLLTDGIHNASGDPLRIASAMSDLPMVVVPIGNPDPVRDVVLHHVQAPNVVFLNDKAVIEGTVDVTGCAGEEVVVELLEGQTVVESEKFQVLGDSFVRQVTFSRKAEKLGHHEYQVRVQPVPNERVADNNEARLSLEVTEDKIRVLLADNLPRWEYRYLQNLFKRDERIQYQPLVIEPRQDSGRPAQGTGLPDSLEGWGRYHVVILGDLPPSILDARQQALLEEYVAARGGTVIVIAGDAAMPSAYAGSRVMQLLPVTAWESPLNDPPGFGLFLTSEGQTATMLQFADTMAASEQVWREVTTQLPVYGLSRYSKAKPTSHVLIGASARSGAAARDAQERPAFLSWHYYGRGKVVYLSAPVTYQLRLRRGDEMHHRFWGQLLRWAIAREVAAGSRTVRIATDKPDYVQGEKVQVTVRLSRPDGLAESRAACGLTARLEERVVAALELAEDPDVLGAYKGTLERLPAGRITIQPTGDAVARLLDAEGYRQPVEAQVRIDPPASVELRNTRANLPLLAELARCSNGVLVAPAGVAAAMAHVDLSLDVSESSRQRPLWDQWLCLWIFLGCLTAEWTARKLGGMA